MTYDERTLSAHFHTEKKLPFPLLRDIKAKHVIAYGIRNEDYKPGESGFGVPHPGILLINRDGSVEQKFAYPGFRDRPSFDAIYSAIAEK